MNRISSTVLISLLFIGICGMQAEDLVEMVAVKERPRVYRGPYNETVINSHYYGYPYLGLSSYYNPLFSPLMYMGYAPPGRSSVTFAVGSDGYVGTAFSTSERIKGTNLVYSLSASWEKGESWYPGYDYQVTTISPSLMWSNENMSLYLGFEFSDLSLEDNGSPLKDRPRVGTGPYRSSMPLTRDLNPHFDYNSINLGLNHRLGDRSNLYINAGNRDDFFGGDSVSLGLSHRLMDISAQVRP